ncbi:DUF4303 domain-containing protein [Kitasatospora sp. NPDC001660]
MSAGRARECRPEETPAALESETPLTLLLPAARAAFTRLAEGLGGAERCGYALYSDAAAMTVCCAVNTRDHLARSQAADPDDAEYYRWSPAEWAHEGVGHEYFTEVNRHLLARSMTLGGRELCQWRESVYEACVVTLETLVAEDILERDGDTVVVFVASDHTDAEREAGWIRRLNPPHQALLFTRWLRAIGSPAGEIVPSPGVVPGPVTGSQPVCFSTAECTQSSRPGE